MEKIKLSELEHAPWNPRNPIEFLLSNDAMKGLVASVRAMGVLQPIVVWRDPAADPASPWLVIAGNRRMEAARMARMTEIPAVVSAAKTEAEARAVTREENENRVGVSPIKDMELVKWYKDRGYKQADIGAILNMSEAMVCRRAKLIDLEPSVLEKLNTVKCEARALEIFAAYPPELQKKAVKSMYLGTESVVTAQMARNAFSRLVRQVSRADWLFKGESGAGRFARCACCALCTGNQPDLFDVDGGGTRNGKGERVFLGECLDPKCYKRMEKEAEDAILLGAVIASGGTEEDYRSATTDEPSWRIRQECRKKKSKKAPHCYVAMEWDHTACVGWGEDPAKAEEARKAAAAKEEAMRQEAEAARCRREQVVSAAIERALDLLSPHEGEGFDERVRALSADLAKRPCEIVSDLAAMLFLLVTHNYELDRSDEARIALWVASAYPQYRITEEERAALEGEI